MVMHWWSAHFIENLSQSYADNCQCYACLHAVVSFAIPSHKCLCENLQCHRSIHAHHHGSTTDELHYADIAHVRRKHEPIRPNNFPICDILPVNVDKFV